MILLFPTPSSSEDDTVVPDTFLVGDTGRLLGPRSFVPWLGSPAPVRCTGCAKMAKEEVQVWRPAELAAARIPGAETGQRAVPGFGGPTGEVPKPEPSRAWPETTEPATEGATLLPNGSEAKLPAIFDDALCFHGDSVSRKQVQRWWEEVASEIQMITDAVDAKYELWRAKMAEKDQVIKKLAAKLKELTESPRQSHPPNVFGLSSAPPGSLGLRSPMRSPCKRAANRAAHRTPGSPSGAGRALAAAQSADGLQALLSGSRLGRAGSLSPTNRLDLINGRGSPPEDAVL
eukprot:s625_g6.t1